MDREHQTREWEQRKSSNRDPRGLKSTQATRLDKTGQRTQGENRRH